MDALHFLQRDATMPERSWKSQLGRPTYLSADLYFTGILLLLPFFRRLISELAERNSTKVSHTVGSNCDLKTRVQNLGYLLPLQIGGPKTTFLGRRRNLTANLMAYIFRTKHDINNRSSTLTTSSQCHELWSTNGLNLDLHFSYPP